uniref:Uncharacterized protein n=1 Tax=Ciona savignyi TaxID=51511 RepID=H2Z9A9_CIOSA
MDNVDTSASDCSHISNVKTPMQPRRRRISSPMSNPRKVATTELPPLTDEIQIEIDRRQRNNSTPNDQTSTIDGNPKMGQKSKAVLNNSPQLSDPYKSPPRTKPRKQPKKLNFPDANLFNPVGKRDFGKRPRNLVQESSSDLSGDDTSNMEDVVGQVGQMFRKRIRKKQRPAKRVCRALRDNAKKLREIWSRYSVKRTSELESFNAKFAELGNRQEDLMLNIRTLEADAHQYLTNLQGKYRDVMNQAQTSFVQFKNLQTHIATTQVENERKINRDICRLSTEVTQNLAELTKQSPW